MLKRDLSRKAEQENAMRIALSKLQEEEKDLKNQLSIVGTEDYIVSSAMENYSYVKKDDIRFEFSNPAALYPLHGGRAADSCGRNSGLTGMKSEGDACRLLSSGSGPIPSGHWLPGTMKAYLSAFIGTGEGTRLFCGLDNNGMLKEESILKTAEAVRRMAEAAAEKGTEDLGIFATAPRGTLRTGRFFWMPSNRRRGCPR